ncbi:hypothetical protein M0R45_026668 [Rubus argutus]|uniref:Uncharacterized protein n=1 Tax=Rubus argutus TaxID=59490 RepID=A0AAW1WYN8_RUBAR
MEEGQKPSVSLLDDSEQRKPQAPKRFVRSQIPDSILHDPALNAAIALLPSNYHFEVHKCVWRVRSTAASRVALQLPEGLPDVLPGSLRHPLHLRRRLPVLRFGRRNLRRVLRR